MEKLDNVFSAEFNEAGLVPWQTLNSGKIAGKVKSAGGGGFTGMLDQMFTTCSFLLMILA